MPSLDFEPNGLFRTGFATLAILRTGLELHRTTPNAVHFCEEAWTHHDRVGAHGAVY
jgi:hypothetical protein